MTWRLPTRTLAERLRPDSRSFLIAEGEPMPLVGDVLVFGVASRFAGVPCVDFPSGYPAARITGTQGRTVWYVPAGDDYDYAEPWLLDRRRGEARRVRASF